MTDKEKCVTSYSLDVDGHGGIAWYEEHQLSLVE